MQPQKFPNIRTNKDCLEGHLLEKYCDLLSKIENGDYMYYFLYFWYQCRFNAKSSGHADPRPYACACLEGKQNYIDWFQFHFSANHVIRQHNYKNVNHLDWVIHASIISLFPIKVSVAHKPLSIHTGRLTKKTILRQWGSALHLIKQCFSPKKTEHHLFLIRSASSNVSCYAPTHYLRNINNCLDMTFCFWTAPASLLIDESRCLLRILFGRMYTHGKKWHYVVRYLAISHMNFIVFVKSRYD